MVVLMVAIKDAATELLATKRIAVTGVSRNPKGHVSNVVYQRLQQRGYEVFAVNPNAETSRRLPPTTAGSTRSR
jgi:uncharacterized protein